MYFQVPIVSTTEFSSEVPKCYTPKVYTETATTAVVKLFDNNFIESIIYLASQIQIINFTADTLYAQSNPS